LGGYAHPVWLIVFLSVWRLLQDYVTAPRVMGESLEINPLMQIFAVLAGAEIAGVVGALISVPLVAALRIIWRRISTRKPQTSPLSG
jgi:predicted PurR-regulated permease PerM